MRLFKKIGERASWLLGGCVLAAVLSIGCSRPEQKAVFNTVDMSSVGYAKSWAMTDANGKRRALGEFAGKVVYVYFGYAQCPDICPTTMLELGEVKSALGADGDKLQIVFVTVDPERDTPEIMRAYLGAFDPQAVPLVGTPEEVAVMAKDFKVSYEKVPGASPSTYTVNHSTGSYVYDPNGKLRLYVPYGTAVADLTSDIRQLIDGK